LKQKPQALEMSSEEDKYLIQKWKTEQDVKARNQLVMRHMGLVVTIAKTFPGSRVDLVQEGGLGLMKAIDQYDPNRGVK